MTNAGVIRGDLKVDSERIAAIGDVDPEGEIVDVSGLIILPGMVDTHVHLMDPGDTGREDFIHGTRAAAARGVTTIVEHTHAHPIRGVPDLEEKTAHLRTRSNVDFGLAAHVWPDRIPEIGSLVAAGITFFKIFTCSTHGVPGIEHDQLSEALTAIKQAGGRCLVHNEDQQLTTDAERRLKESGRTDPGLLLEWRTRDAELEATAATAAAVLDSGVAATFAHVSSTGVLDVIDAFRLRGADIAAEACPQYLALEEDEVIDKGALRKFTPPARIRDESDRSAMWDAVVDRRFSHFSTDHAPSTVEQKEAGDFWSAPFGLPGLDTTLPFLLDAALSGRIGLHDLARLYAAAPAARYGLSKGVLAPGSDADLVLVDPTGSWTVRDEDILSKAGWSPFSGKTLQGRVVATFLRGVEVARDGRCHDLRTGRFIRPSRS
ncbi:MAG TPA: amidohydrolase family protein [Acidimicrobiia bacterium]